MSLFTVPKEAFGLDISDFSIKAALLEEKKDGFKVRSFCYLPIPGEILVGGEIKDEGKVVEALRKVVSSCQISSIKNKNVVVSVPEAKSFVRVIELPKMEKRELKEAVQWETEQHIPVNIENVYFDWQILEEDRAYLKSASPKEKARKGFLETKEGKISVLVAACRKTLIDSYYNALVKAGFNPLVFEAESQATVRVLINETIKDKAVLIADMGGKRTSFIIFDKGAIRFTSSVAFSGELLTKEIAVKLGTDIEEAEAIKIACGLDKTKRGGKVFEIIEPVLASLTADIEHAINFYHSHYPQCNKINTILLCGGGSGLAGLADYLALRLKTKVMWGNPWLNIIPDYQERKARSRKMPIPPKHVFRFVTALGLAMRGANLKKYHLYQYD